MIDPILLARELRQNQIQDMLENHELVISVKSNIPGLNKNISEAYFLVRLFLIEIGIKINIQEHIFLESEDGPYHLIPIKHGNPDIIKNMLIDIETVHPLGRFIDLDVFTQKIKSISRQDIGKPPRQCYLCSLDAHVCSRNQTHDIADLIEYVKENITDYLNDKIRVLIDQSIMMELELDDKFGLVTKSSKGSHDDMDYELMIRAKNVLVPYFQKLFMMGYEAYELDHLLEETRPIGIEAELKMLDETNGVNCYKGLIFILGLAVLSSGFVLGHHQNFSEVFSNVSTMTKDVFKEFEMNPSTFGMEAYQKHQIKGVRGEVYLGLPSVKKVMKDLLHSNTLNDSVLRETLRKLILESEDTVFLKRSGSIERYQEFKNILKSVDPNDMTDVKAFTLFAIQNNLSFGGSADLLVVSIYLYFIHKTFINY